MLQSCVYCLIVGLLLELFSVEFNSWSSIFPINLILNFSLKNLVRNEKGVEISRNYLHLNVLGRFVWLNDLGRYTMNGDLGPWWVTFKLAGQVFGEMSDELQRLGYPGFGDGRWINFPFPLKNQFWNQKKLFMIACGELWTPYGSWSDRAPRGKERLSRVLSANRIKRCLLHSTS